jgi:hypothetical protein
MLTLSREDACAILKEWIQRQYSTIEPLQSSKRQKFDQIPSPTSVAAIPGDSMHNERESELGHEGNVGHVRGSTGGLRTIQQALHQMQQLLEKAERATYVTSQQGRHVMIPKYSQLVLDYGEEFWN